jgi:hypothetical protein
MERKTTTSLTDLHLRHDKALIIRIYKIQEAAYIIDDETAYKQEQLFDVILAMANTAIIVQTALSQFKNVDNMIKLQENNGRKLEKHIHISKHSYLRSRLELNN